MGVDRGALRYQPNRAYTLFRTRMRCRAADRVEGKLFEKVIGADISSPHLAFARQALNRRDWANVDLVHLHSFAALKTIPHLMSSFLS